jgi:hypothetical protein
MLKLLIMAYDLEEARQIAESLDIPKLYIMDEHMVREATGILESEDSPGYGARIIQKMSTYVKTFKAIRPIAVVVHMRHSMAVRDIPHDVSCLIYDGSQSRRLQYSPSYKTTFKIRDSADEAGIAQLISAIKNLG